MTTDTATPEHPVTALVLVRPDIDPGVLALYQEGLGLLRFAEARIIGDGQDIKTATDDLSIIARLKKAIEERRREYVGPLNDHLRAVNEAFRGLTDPISQADTITRRKILDFRAEQERIRIEQERINRLREEAAQAEMRLKGELSEPLAQIPVSPESPSIYRTDSATLGKTTIKKWEVVDLQLVPIEYLVIDAAKVGKVVRAGIPSIPGIRIWTEESLRVTPA